LSLLQSFDNSLLKLLTFAFPDTQWSEILTAKVASKKIKTRNSEIDLVKAREVFDKIGQELGVKQLSDWYQVPISEIRKRTSITRHFANKYEAFKIIYPEYEWDIFHFNWMPNKSWQDKTVQKQFFENIKQKLNISTEELLNLPVQTICSMGGTGLMKSISSRKYEILLSGCCNFHLFHS